MLILNFLKLLFISIKKKEKNIYLICPSLICSKPIIAPRLSLDCTACKAHLLIKFGYFGPKNGDFGPSIAKTGAKPKLKRAVKDFSIAVKESRIYSNNFISGLPFCPSALPFSLSLFRFSALEVSSSSPPFAQLRHAGRLAGTAQKRASAFKLSNSFSVWYSSSSRHLFLCVYVFRASIWNFRVILCTIS